MTGATIERTESGSVLLRVPFNALLVEDLKLGLPPRGRRWEPTVWAWVIESDCLVRAVRIVERYYPVRTIDTVAPSPPPSSYRETECHPPRVTNFWEHY